MRLAAAFVLVSAATCVSAQTFKCKDPSGSVTYSNEACEKQGLKDAGKVRERLTTMPTEPLPVRKLSPKPEKSEPEKKDGEKKP